MKPTMRLNVLAVSLWIAVGVSADPIDRDYDDYHNDRAHDASHGRTGLLNRAHDRALGQRSERLSDPCYGTADYFRSRYQMNGRRRDLDCYEQKVREESDDEDGSE